MFQKESERQKAQEMIQRYVVKIYHIFFGEICIRVLSLWIPSSNGASATHIMRLVREM